MISPSSVSTRMTLASSVLVWRRPPAGAAGETAKLIRVAEAHVTAHSTAPGARLSDDLEDQVSTTSTGGRAPFSARNGAPRQGRPRTVRRTDASPHETCVELPPEEDGAAHPSVRLSDGVD